MKNIIKISFLFQLFFFNVSFAQYFGERVMEKSFEQSDFIFTPYRLVPYGIGTFKNSLTGVLDDPLLNLDINPAYFYRDSIRENYIYLDFRTARDIRDTRSIYFPYGLFPVLDSRVNFMPYPQFYINTRRELEPALSVAYLLRPHEGVFQHVSLGATYQLVSQDEKYYPIPEDIYRSVLGVDYLGVRSDAAKNVPIVDKYSGTDNIHQEGHFLSFFAGYDITSHLQVGAKISRVSFDREGSYGSQNVWDSYYSINSTSLWRNSESRNQSYSHWELTGGVNYMVDEKYSLGFTGGYLWGDASQALTRGDSSFWGYGKIGSLTDNWNYYLSSGNQHQTRNHNGKTALVGIDMKMQVSTTQLLQFHYQYVRKNIDIGLSGVIFDTSYGKSKYTWDTNMSDYTSDYALRDVRNGNGATVGKNHRAVGSLQWNISPKVKLSLGIQYENQTMETNTSENVLSMRHSRYTNIGTYPYTYFDSSAESKTLEWGFRSKLTRFSIPIFFSIRTSDVVELLFGLNRSASSWRVNDVTLALFNYRMQANLQDTVYNVNFGERYTQPEERVSEVQTTLLAGITVMPSNVFNVRFLVVPNFVETYTGTDLSDLQWWITLNVLP